jgi:ATP-binding cassette subfamily F protein 3
MAKLTELLARVDEALQAPDAFIKDPAKAALLSGQRAELEKTLMGVEEEWLTLSADYESAL